VYYFQMIYLRGAYVIEWKRNTGCTWCVMFSAVNRQVQIWEYIWILLGFYTLDIVLR